MPWYIRIYLLVFAVMLICNLAYWVKGKGRPLMLFYELLSGFAVIVFASALWLPWLRGLLSVWAAASFAAVLAADFAMSVFAKQKDLGITLEREMSDGEFDTAKTLSLLFAAPAYIAGALTALELLKS
jgi:hypothetical protein